MPENPSSPDVDVCVEEEPVSVVVDEEASAPEPIVMSMAGLICAVML